MENTKEGLTVEQEKRVVINNEYEAFTGKKFWTKPVRHGDVAFASWEYQIWLENELVKARESVLTVPSIPLTEDLKSDEQMRTVLPGTKMSEKKNVSGKPPLSEGHICFERGHAMYEVFKFKNAANGHSSEWGQHKCSRCGYEENWQYDFV